MRVYTKHPAAHTSLSHVSFVKSTCLNLLSFLKSNSGFLQYFHVHTHHERFGIKKKLFVCVSLMTHSQKNDTVSTTDQRVSCVFLHNRLHLVAFICAAHLFSLPRKITKIYNNIIIIQRRPHLYISVCFSFINTYTLALLYNTNQTAIFIPKQIFLITKLRCAVINRTGAPELPRN